jgi:DNA anti-recombination protein RmuC
MLPQMKRVLFALASSAFLGLLNPQASAQDAGATARAERIEIEERYRRMNDSVRQLISANTALQSRVGALAEDMRRLHGEVQAEKSRVNSHATRYVTQEEMRALAKKIQEIDEKRQADKKRLVEEIRTMLKAVSPGNAGRAALDEKEKEVKKPRKTGTTKKKAK